MLAYYALVFIMHHPIHIGIRSRVPASGYIALKIMMLIMLFAPFYTHIIQLGAVKLAHAFGLGLEAIFIAAVELMISIYLKLI
jgi:hypothetical protein